MIAGIFGVSLMAVLSFVAGFRRLGLIILGINLVLVLALLWHLMTDTVPINW